MKISWPPEETKGWILEPVHTIQTKYFFTNFPKPTHIFLLGYRIIERTTPNLELITVDNKRFTLSNEPNTWHTFPWPIESHTLCTVWSHIESATENLSIELAYCPNSLREYYMRVLLNSEGEMVFAYRYNKNGKLMWFSAYKTEVMTLPEEALTFPLVNQINERGIHLLARNSLLKTKKEVLSNGTE